MKLRSVLLVPDISWIWCDVSVIVTACIHCCGQVCSMISASTLLSDVSRRWKHEVRFLTSMLSVFLSVSLSVHLSSLMLHSAEGASVSCNAGGGGSLSQPIGISRFDRYIDKHTHKQMLLNTLPSSVSCRCVSDNQHLNTHWLPLIIEVVNVENVWSQPLLSISYCCAGKNIAFCQKKVIWIMIRIFIVLYSLHWCKQCFLDLVYMNLYHCIEF